MSALAKAPAARRERVTIVRTFDEFARVAAVRTLAYIAGQDCPYDEEFDGNDLCAMHLLGWIGDEPVASLRIRFFGDFAKVERLAVRPEHRRSTIAFRMVREALEIVARKGFTRAYGHARDGLEKFWGRFGAKPMGPRCAFSFSGQGYTEMLLELPSHADAIRLGADPLVTIRPEGDWDRPGVLERGAHHAEAETAPEARAEPPEPTVTSGWSSDLQAAWRKTFMPRGGFEEHGEAWTDEGRQELARAA